MLPALNRKWPALHQPRMHIRQWNWRRCSVGQRTGDERIEHRILLPPERHGTLLELAPEGDYRLEDPIGRDTRATGAATFQIPSSLAGAQSRPYRRRDNSTCR